MPTANDVKAASGDGVEGAREHRVTTRIVFGVDVDFFASCPIDDPLSYPGVIPPYSYVLSGPHSLTPVTSLSALSLAGRHPVIAVGSNAAPAQLARKFFPNVPIRSDLSGNKSFFSSSKAERMLGWKHRLA